MPIAPEFLHLKGREKMKVCLLWLWGVLKGRGGYVTCRALIGIMHVAVSMGFIVISKYLVDVATGQEAGNLKLGMVALVVCVCLQLLFGVWGSRLGVHASVKMGNALRSSIFGGVMRSCWKGRESLHTGDVMNRMEGDVDTVTSLLCHTLPMVVVSCVQFVAAFLFLGILDGRLAIVLAVVMPVAFLLSKSYVKRMRSLTHDLLGAESKLQAFMQEHLQNRLLVLTLEYTDRSLKGLDGILQDLKGLVFRRTDYSLFSKCVVQGGFSLGYVAAFLWGVGRRDCQLRYDDGIPAVGCPSATAGTGSGKTSACLRSGYRFGGALDGIGATSDGGSWNVCAIGRQDRGAYGRGHVCLC